MFPILLCFNTFSAITDGADTPPFGKKYFGLIWTTLSWPHPPLYVHTCICHCVCYVLSVYLWELLSDILQCHFHLPAYTLSGGAWETCSFKQTVSLSQVLHVSHCMATFLSMHATRSLASSVLLNTVELGYLTIVGVQLYGHREISDREIELFLLKIWKKKVWKSD